MNLTYRRGTYQVDGTTAIQSFKDGEPWSFLSVNLFSYGMMPPSKDHIFIPAYKLTTETIEQFKEDLVEEIVDTVQIGMGTGFLAKLKPEWRNLEEIK